MATEKEIALFEAGNKLKLPGEFREYLMDETAPAFLFDGGFHWFLAVFPGEVTERSKGQNGVVPSTLESSFVFKGQTTPFWRAGQLVASVSKANGWALGDSDNKMKYTGPRLASWDEFADSITLASRPMVGWLLVYFPSRGIVRALCVGQAGSELMMYGSAKPGYETDFAELMHRTRKYLEDEQRKKEEAARRRAERKALNRPAGAKQAAPATAVEAFEQKHGVEFGKALSTFLEKWKGGTVTSPDGSQWEIYSLTDLEKNMPGIKSSDGKPLKKFQSMRFFSELVEQVAGEEGVEIQGADRTLSAEDLAQTLCIGETNGDPLFLDPDSNNRLLVLYHDGMDVEVVTENIAKWISQCQPEK